jgi:hypothetical protein
MTASIPKTRSARPGCLTVNVKRPPSAAGTTTASRKRIGDPLNGATTRTRPGGPPAVPCVERCHALNCAAWQPAQRWEPTKSLSPTPSSGGAPRGGGSDATLESASPLLVRHTTTDAPAINNTAAATAVLLHRTPASALSDCCPDVALRSSAPVRRWFPERAVCPRLDRRRLLIGTKGRRAVRSRSSPALGSRRDHDTRTTSECGPRARGSRLR